MVVVTGIVVVLKTTLVWIAEIVTRWVVVCSWYTVVAGT
jgi:hypothetical protein